MCFTSIAGSPTEKWSNGVRTHSEPERDDGGEEDGGQKVDGELVVATPEVLEAAMLELC
jgi:hypothetical protein